MSITDGELEASFYDLVSKHLNIVWTSRRCLNKDLGSWHRADIFGNRYIVEEYSKRCEVNLAVESNLNSKPDRVLDCVGMYCPIPVLKVREELDRLSVGQVLEVWADDPAAEEDIPRLAKRIGQEILEMKKDGSRLRFLLKKTK